MKNLITEFQNVSKLFQETVDNFPASQHNKTLFDQWSLKDVLAHILGWHKLFLTNLDNLVKNKPPVDWGKIDEFNHQNVAHTHSSNFQLIYQDLKKTDQKLIAKLKSLSPQDWQKKFWSSRIYTPEKILKIEIKHYQKTHTPQIKKFLDK